MGPLRPMLFAAFLALAAAAEAAPSDVDPSFGSGGRVAFGPALDYVLSIRLDEDGRILVVGPRAVARFDYDGTPDATFGEQGVITSPEGEPVVAVSDAGVLFSRASELGQTELLRLRPDGAPDESFGEGGVLTFTPPAGYQGTIVQGAAGELVIESYDIDPPARRLTRLLPSGEPDVAFGEDGTIETPLPGLAPLRLAFQRDGRLVVGTAGCPDYPASCGTFVFARFLPDGSLDRSFGTDGLVTTSVGDFSYLDWMELMRDGRLFAAGPALVRYLPDGTTDPEFGVVPLTGIRAATASVNSIGEVVVAGDACAPDYSHCERVVTRYRPDGTIDAGFGACGFLSEGLPPYPLAAFDHRRGILVAGQTGMVRLVGGRSTGVPRCADLAVRGQAQRVPFGRTARYRIVVRNTGTAAASATSVRLVDDDPAGLMPRLRRRAAEPGGCRTRQVDIECRVGTLQPGESAQLVLDVLEYEPGVAVDWRVEARSGSREADYGDNAAAFRLESVTARARCANLVDGGGAPDVLLGGDEPATLRGYGGEDLIRAGGGADCVLGGPDGDELHAGPGADSVSGGIGDDWLFGGPGRDRLDAGPGDDRVLARDGLRDRVDCGPGTDTVVADRRDRLSRCERRRR